MKDLKNIMEGILDQDNKNNVGNSMKDIYPVPTVKDFKTGPFGDSIVKWTCTDLIQPQLDGFDLKDLTDVDTYVTCNKSDIIGLFARIDRDKCVNMYLMYTTGGINLEKISLTGVGDWVGSLPTAKKSVINSFNMLNKNPELFKKIFNYAKKATEEMRRTGMASCKPIEDILKH